jgi:aryl-alcohol dehydrogenase-like predicted oxidoreductase
LARRRVEADLRPVMLRRGLSLLPFFPLASGLLTGKYQAGQPFPEDSRFAKMGTKYGRFRSERNYQTVARLQAFARDRGRSVLDLALSWLVAQPVVGSVIAGASRPSQIAVNVAAAAWTLTPDDLDEVDRITMAIPEAGSPP